MKKGKKGSTTLQMGITEEEQPRVFIAIGKKCVELEPEDALDFSMNMLKATYEIAMLRGLTPASATCH